MKNNLIDIKRSETGPTEPVSLEEIKDHLIITFTDDDNLLVSLLTKARKAIENHCSISIVTQTIILTADLYTEWELPFGPVLSISAVKTRATNEGSGPLSYTTAASGWNTDGQQFLTFIPEAAGGFNPSNPFRGYFQWGQFMSPYGGTPQNRYQITYTAGYPNLPDDIKHAILMQIAWMYEHRGESDANKYDWRPGVCEGALILSDPYKRQAWL